jgi:hypothetical protein
MAMEQRQMNPQKALRRIFLTAMLGAAVASGAFLQAAQDNGDVPIENTYVTIAVDKEEAQRKLDLALVKVFDPYSNLADDEIIVLAKKYLALGAHIDGGPQGVPLHYVISFRSERPVHLVKFLLDNGANPNARDNIPDNLETPLMALVSAITLNGGFPMMEEDRAMLTLLLDRGAAVDAKDARGWTALHLVALNAIGGKGGSDPSLGKFEALADFLRSYGANPLLKDAGGRTALDLVKTEAPENKAAIAYLQNWERQATAKAKLTGPGL